MRTLFWAAMLCAVVVCTPVFARPFTTADFLQLESPGATFVDPTGRWLIHDMQGRYADAPRFDNDTNTRPLYSHLLRVDLHHPAGAIPAFKQDRHGGYVTGPFSPDGRYVTVYRNLNRRWDLGVLEIQSRHIRWLGFGVEFTDRGDTVLWKSNTHLIALRMPTGDRYWKERAQQSAMQQLPGLWLKQNAGAAPTAMTIGSGKYIDTHVPDPSRQVVDVDVKSGAIRGYASGVFDALSLSASTQRVALIEATGRVRLSGAHLLGLSTQFRKAELRLLDLKSGALSTPCPLEPLFTSLRWSPSSDDLLAFMRPRGADDWSTGAFKRIGPNGQCRHLPTGALRTEATTDSPGGYTQTHGEWLGGVPIILATASGDRRADWFRLTDDAPIKLTAFLKEPPGDPILISGDHALFLENGAVTSVDSQGVAKTLLAAGITRVHVPRRSNNSALVPEDGAPRLPEIFASADHDATTTLWKLEANAASKVLQTSAQDQTYQAATSDALIVLATDAHGVSKLELHRAYGRTIVLTQANRQLEAIDNPVPIPIHHFGLEGESLTSWLYMPTVPFQRPPPVIVMAYPGVVYSTPPHCSSPGLCPFVQDVPFLAVARGYAVLIPSMPTSKDAAPPAAVWGRQMGDILKALAASGKVDADHIGYWGHSYGGYAGLVLATEPNQFKAIIAAAPVADMVSVRTAPQAAWLTSYEAEAMGAFGGWSEIGQGHIMAMPWSAPDRFIQASPIFAADRIHTPILLAQGDQDVLTIDQSREMFSALTRLGKDALFMTFYGEGHSIVSPPNVRVYVDAAFSFLDS